MKFKLLLLTSFAVIAGLFAQANGGEPLDESNELTRKNDIAGNVYNNDTKKPLNNVTITAYLLSKKEKIVLTDSRGNYSIDDLKPGTYKFVFEKDGYKKVIKEKVVIRQDEGFELNVELAEQANFEFMPGPAHFFDLELD